MAWNVVKKLVDKRNSYDKKGLLILQYYVDNKLNGLSKDYADGKLIE